ncbi:MAG: tetratricopeptide repeat protein [Myxococcales bacterium]
MSILIAALLLAAATPPESANLAREHFKAGQTHYALGEFQKAVEEFRETYRLRQEPALLFNIGQAYRQLHDWTQALFHYRQYLALRPDAPNRAEVEDLVGQMQRQLDLEAQQKAQAARSAAAPPEAILPSPHPAPAGAPPSAPPGHDARWLRIAAGSAAGLGLLAEGGALALHGSAQSAANEFNGKYQAGQLTAADAALKSTAESRGRLAAVALIGGAALLATGAVLWFAF